MAAGKFDRRITLEAASSRTSAAGAVEQVWTRVADAWAELVSSSGGESFGDDQVTAITRATWKIRYRPNVTTSMRIVARGQVYEINDVTETDRNRELVLSCTALNIQSGNA